MNILLVDDDRSGRAYVADFLRELNHTVDECENGEDALHAFDSGSFQMVLSDIKMPKMSGLDLLQAIKATSKGRRDVSVVLFTGHGDMETAIQALKAGAFDYLLKPISVEELAIVTDRISRFHEMRQENRRLTNHFKEEVAAATAETVRELETIKKLAAKAVGIDSIYVLSEAMSIAVKQAEKYHTDRTIPVLIQGDTGTGKEIIARLIHYGGLENIAPFVDINCAAITPSLFESELFGYDEGSFTGSLRGGKKGKFEMAARGTLFLDEVAEIPLELQGKLLRVLQEKEFYRVGGDRKVKTDVRIICATNTDLEQRVQEGRFRRDLYFRLKIGQIILPSLQERREEIIPLAQHFMQQFSKEKNKRFTKINDMAKKMLLSHPWTGNVRELKNVIEWVVFMYDDVEIKSEHLGMLVSFKGSEEPKINTLDAEEFLLPLTKFDFENHCDQIVRKALEMHAGNKTKAAQYLNVSRSSLNCRLKKLSL